MEAYFHVAVTVHMDPVILDDPETNRLRFLTDNIVQAIEPTLTMHDFRLTKTAEGGRSLLFDIVVPHGVSLHDEEIARAVGEQLKALHPRYQAVIHFDHQYC